MIRGGKALCKCMQPSMQEHVQSKKEGAMEMCIVAERGQADMWRDRGRGAGGQGGRGK